jgi:hypothetical protein
MNGQGDQAVVTPESEARLRAHVATILSGGAVPLHLRDDLTEELYGHLVERIRAHQSGGLSEADAVEHALAELGGADQLAAEFRRTYHSRLWASTIGVLLPAVASKDEWPAVVGWLRFTLALTMLVIGVGLVLLLPQATPVHAMGLIVVEAFGLVAMNLAIKGLARGQRWALLYAMGICVALLAWGVESVLVTPWGSITIPLGAILAAGVLLGVYAAWDRLRVFVAGSGSVGRKMGVVLLLSLLIPSTVPPVLAALPDPTRAGPDDLIISLSMYCDRGDAVVDGVGVVGNIQRVTLVADMRWRRSDLLPKGVAGLFNSSGFGDSAGFRLLDEAPDLPLPTWLLANGEVSVVDVATGEQAGWFGSTAPSVALLPETIGSFTIGIASDAIRAGHTVRATWLLTPVADAGAAWPRIEFAYAHLDRFLLEGTVSCGQTTTAHQVPLPPPASPQVPSNPFDLPRP